VNERLARHYGIPGVYGSRFRRVQVTDPNRRGLLGQAASCRSPRSQPHLTDPARQVRHLELPEYAAAAAAGERAAARGERAEDRPSTVREQLELHRANVVCARVIATSIRSASPSRTSMRSGSGSRRRGTGLTIDSAGVLADGTKVDGPVALRNALLARPNVFVGTITEKLMTYGLGRGLERSTCPSCAASSGARARETTHAIDHSGHRPECSVPDANEVVRRVRR
jgi:hypothetical protein